MPLIERKIDSSDFWNERPFPQKITKKAIIDYLKEMDANTLKEYTFMRNPSKKTSHGCAERLAKSYEENFGAPHNKEDIDTQGIHIVCENYVIGYLEGKRP